MLNMKVLTFSGIAGGHNLMSPYLGQKAILLIISKLANHVVLGDLPEGKGHAGELHEGETASRGWISQLSPHQSRTFSYAPTLDYNCAQNSK